MLLPHKEKPGRQITTRSDKKGVVI